MNSFLDLMYNSPAPFILLELGYGAFYYIRKGWAAMKGAQSVLDSHEIPCKIEDEW